MPDSIAHYRIGSKLGQGAMGEVYRATDTKLGRDVAIKLIAPALAEDPSRLASFTREAQVLASLNHPNIAAIYGVEDHALVMELVEGPTLADRIKQGPIPLDEALRIARQIAEGLAAAHDRGIVHRDLKPANIKLTPDGTVKLLDFGLAKAAAVAAVSQDEAATVAFSMAGADVIAGTPAYMAPEQARGLPLDRRADIWAFGVVLYEMLTGTTLFTGQTTTDIMAAVVREQPDLARVPAVVRPVLRRCLEKDPKRRLRDVGDAILLLEMATEAPAAETRRSGVRAWLPWAAAAAAFVAFAGLLTVHLREAAPPADTIRFKVTLPPEITVTQTTPFAVSPDGRMIAFPAINAEGLRRIWVQPLDALEPRPISTAEVSAPDGTAVLWSRDSRSIFYWNGNDGSLKRVDVAGGPPTVIATLGRNLLGLVMGTDGTILYGTPSGIMRTDESGTAATPVTKTDPQKGPLHAVFSILPDNKHFLYSAGAPPGERIVSVGSIDVKPEEQDTAPLVKTDNAAVFVPATEGAAKGYLLMVQGGTLVAQPFDADARKVSGEARPVAENVFATGSPQFGVPFYAAIPRALVYRTGTLADRLSRQLAWIGRDGKVQTTLSELGRFNQVKLSPDGMKAVSSRTELQTGNFADLWITDLDAETSTKFTFGGGGNVQPVWSPDGKYIAWGRGREKDLVILRKSADGAGPEEELVTLEGRRNLNLSDWTSDGAFLIYSWGGDVFALPATGPDRQPIPIAATPANEFGAAVSPNRRWIAYLSNETKRQEVYVQPFSPGSQATAGIKWLISNKGTSGLIRWRADSSELVFLNADGGLESVKVTSAPVFKASAPQLIFQMPRPFLVQAGTPGALADASRDLTRFIVAMPSESSRRQELSVVLNWQNDQRR
jgi:Tol biopolymer transport system component/predicted Ser/Thr protein kinase